MFYAGDSLENSKGEMKLNLSSMASTPNHPTASVEIEYQMQHIIDIPKIIQPAIPHLCCIYKVPPILREPNAEPHIPKLISIGPLHHSKLELKPMEEHKKNYFHFFWERLPNKRPLAEFKTYLEEKEEEICQCYSEKFPNHKVLNHFVNMILLDSVFIVELFLRKSKKSKYQNDHIISKPWLSKTIQRDLLLLENQLPIFVLNKLYSHVVPDEIKEHGNFVKLAHDYFETYYPHKSSSKNFVLEKWENSLHFTDLIRHSYLPLDLSSFDTTECVLRTATKLNEAGVSFQKVKNRSLLDIKFEKKKIFSWFLCLSCLPFFNCFKARFQIPQLKVDNTTECVLRNLIAFEQCHYPEEPYICNYVSLIDSLIHTKEDVEFLVDEEVIIHELGSDTELATLVNGLCKNVVTDTTCYHQIIGDLNQHYQKIWNRTMAALKLVYFRDPWRASSTVVGIAVLVFTIINFCRVVRVVF